MQTDILLFISLIYHPILTDITNHYYFYYVLLLYNYKYYCFWLLTSLTNKQNGILS